MNTPEHAPPRRRLAIIRWPKAALLGLCALVLAGCTVVTLAYNRLPTVTYWWLDSRLDLNEAQTPRVRQALDTLWDWHRRTELPRMAATLRDWQTLVAGPVQPAQMCAQLAVVQEWADQFALQAIGRLAPLAATLEPRQIDHLERHQRESNAEFRRDYLGDPAQAMQARLERATDRLEMLYGTLNPAQERALAEGLRRSGFDAARILAEREERQATLRALLREATASTQAPARWTAALQAEWAALARPSAGAAKERRDAQINAGCDWLAAVHNAATPAQRQRAQQTLQSYARDFTELALAGR